MPLFDERTIAHYKKNDPQGTEGFWLDMMMEITILVLMVLAGAGLAHGLIKLFQWMMP